MYIASFRNEIWYVPKVIVKTKLLTGTYILQVNRAAFNQNEASPLCLLCQENNETAEHSLLQWMIGQEPFHV